MCVGSACREYIGGSINCGHTKGSQMILTCMRGKRGRGGEEGRDFRDRGRECLMEGSKQGGRGAGGRRIGCV